MKQICCLQKNILRLEAWKAFFKIGFTFGNVIARQIFFLCWDAIYIPFALSLFLCLSWLSPFLLSLWVGLDENEYIASHLSEGREREEVVVVVCNLVTASLLPSPPLAHKLPIGFLSPFLSRLAPWGLLALEGRKGFFFLSQCSGRRSHFQADTVGFRGGWEKVLSQGDPKTKTLEGGREKYPDTRKLLWPSAPTFWADSFFVKFWGMRY